MPTETPTPSVDPAASVSPNTTLQQDMTLAGQRRVNLIWEYTQAAIAGIMVFSCVVAAMFNVFSHIPGEIPPVLSNTLFLVVGFYFSRTNHQAIGGVGPKANQDDPYKGR